MRRNTKIVLFSALTVVLIVVAICAFWAWQWQHQAPQAARLLPESDAVVYVNLRPLRLASVFANLPPVSRDPGYAAFVNATGFKFESDLDEAAIAIHLPPAQNAANPATPGNETRYSEVFIGRFDLAKLSAYFQSIAKSSEQYKNEKIYSIPVEDRTVRLALISPSLAVVSNSEDPQIIRALIDNALALHAAGPSLVRTLYKDVPFGSLAWALAGSANGLPLPNGLSVPLPGKTKIVGSVRFAGEVQLEAQALTENPDQAKELNDSLSALLAIFRSVQASTQPKGADPDAKALFDSIEAHPDGSREIITATVTVGFLKKMANEAQ